MNSLSQIARNDLKSNKAKNRLILLTIILSTCLMTSICILSYSIHSMLLNNIIEENGAFHGAYKDISENQFDILKNNYNIKSAGESIEAGSVTNIDDAYITLLYMDKNAADMNGISILSGRLPKSSNEIAVQKWVLEKFNAAPKTGETIHVEYISEDGKKSYSDFVVCGVLKDNKSKMAMRSGCAVVSKDFIFKNVKNENIKRTAYVKVKAIMNIPHILSVVGKDIGYSSNVSTNDMYLNAFGGDFKSIIPFAALGIIVMFAASIVIYNIFYISVAERIKTFGLLSAVGTTKKQIKKIIFKEGLILSSVGILLGIAAGYAFSYIIVPIFNIDNIKITSSPIIALISALVSLFTVFIAIRKPAKMASKISPMEAIRFSGENIDIKKAFKSNKNTINIDEIACINLFRNKKRTMITLLSLIMSGTIFIIFSTILGSMNVENLTRNYISSDFELTSSNIKMDTGGDPLNNSIINKIASLNGTQSVDSVKYSNVCLSNISCKMEIGGMQQTINDPECSYFGFDESLLKKEKKYLLSGDISIDKLKNTDEVLVVLKDSHMNFNYKVGDKIPITVYQISSDGKGTSKTKIFTIGGILKKNIISVGWYDLGPTFITHNSSFDRTTGDSRVSKLCINADSNKYKDVEAGIKNIIGRTDKIKFTSYRELKESYEKTQKGIEAAAMSLVVIIALIGLFNLVNTMITSILSRKKEFGLMQAVGLSDLQLKKMLRIEAMFYALFSSLLSIILGTAIGYEFYKAFKIEATYAEYKFPLIPIILIIVVYISFQLLITFAVEKELNKDSIVDRIRYNE